MSTEHRGNALVGFAYAILFDLVIAAIVVGVVLAFAPSSHADPLPMCATSQGNPNDAPCYVPRVDGGADLFGACDGFGDENGCLVVDDNGNPVLVTLTSAQTSLPACTYEDGNPDGSACTWFDPDTGNGYYVGSDNYDDDR